MVRRRRRVRRRIGALPGLDDLLGTVLDHYQAADPSKLPGPVQDAYIRARGALDAATHSVAGTLGLDLSDLTQQARAAGAVLGGATPELVAMAGGILSGNAQATFQAMQAATVGILTVINPAMGAVAAVAEQMFDAIMAAWPATGHTAALCEGWYGGFGPGSATTPFGPEDTNLWIPWTNKTPGLRSNGSACADDTPTLAGRSAPVYMTADNTRAWFGISGKFLWLESIIAAAPSGFDVQACHSIGVMLERYMNRRGPAPDTVGSQSVWPMFSLADAMYAMLVGWNATHQGPMISVDTAGGPMVHVPAQTSSWGGRTTTTPAHDDRDWPASDRLPGAVLWRTMPPGHVLTLAVGPMNPDIARLFAAPARIIHLHAPRAGRPMTAPAAATPADVAVVYPYWFTGTAWMPEPGHWGDLGTVYAVSRAHPGAPVGYYAWDGAAMHWRSVA